MDMKESTDAIIVMYTTSWCSDCQRAKYVLDEYGVAYREVDVERDAAGMAFVRRVNGGRRTVPTLVFPDGTLLVEPTVAELAERAGIDLSW